MALKRKRGRPKEAAAADKASILEIALKEFGAKGYEGVTMVGLAKAAGISDSLLYYHFGNKEQLWREAIAVKVNELRGILEESEALLKDIGGLAKLKVMLRKFIYFNANNMDFNKAVHREMINRTARAKWMIETLVGPMNAMMEQHIREAQDAGLMKEIPMANLTALIIGASTSFFKMAYQSELLYGINPMEEAQIEQHADIVNSIFFGSLE